MPFLHIILISFTIMVVWSGPSRAEGAGQVRQVEVPAPALSGNLLGTPEVQSVAVYLPPGYDAEDARHYPSLYLLHGIFDDYEVWTEFYQIGAMLDRLIADGEVPPMIVVMPNAGNRYGGGYYRNSPVSGRWADYIADDLVGFIDAEFRTLPEARAVVGHSMGGYGALHLAMTRPGLFSVVWAMSPCCLSARDDLGFGNFSWRQPSAVSSAEDLDAIMSGGNFYQIAALGVITAFSPNAAAPPVHGDFPFEIVRGEVVLQEDEYQRFLDALPVRQVRQARAHLRALKGLAMDVGLGDQFLHIPPGTLEFSQELGAERIPHLLDLHAGDHRQHVADRLEAVVLPWVADRLAAGN